MSKGLRLQGESWLAVWARRAVSIPIVFALTALVIASLPAWLPILLLLEALSSRKVRFAKARACLFFCVYLCCETIGTVASFVVWVCYLGGLKRDVAYLHANAWLQRYFSDALFFGAVRIFGMQLKITGDAGKAPYLLFVRHASTADTVLAAALLANRERVIMRYVLKRELLWDPCIDIVGRRLPNAFVNRAKGRTDADIAALESLTTNMDEHSAVLMFPEGTRFSQSKLKAAQLALASSDLHAVATGYRNVLPPKLRGPLALLAAAPTLDVVFLEHTGFEGARSFDRFFAGELVGRTIHVRFRRVAAKDIPSETRAAWLFEQWSLCDEFVTSHIQGRER